MKLPGLASAISVLVLSATVTRPEPVADVVTIGGSITEIAYALGQGHRLLARDTTSTYPEDAQALPDIGYMRNLSAEGVLVYAPALIVSEEGAGPPEVIDILEAASVDFYTVPTAYNVEGIGQKIRLVGDALDVSQQAEALATQVEKALEDAQDRAQRQADDPKRVLFILSTQGGRLLASGSDTGADAIIQMAGAVNAVSGFDGYKNLSDEAVAAAAPDVVLMMNRGGDHTPEDDELFAIPALAATPAGQSRSVVKMNGLYLLGFGPRTAEAVLELNAALYADAD